MKISFFVVIASTIICNSTENAIADDFPNQPFIQPEPKMHGHFWDDKFELLRFPGWYKPADNLTAYKGQTRLLIQLTKDGKAIVNPHEKSPCQAIDLRDLSMENAVMLWGQPRDSDKGVKTFDLLSQSRVEGDVYHFDIKFKNGKLESYRLRGIGILVPVWATPN
jgi:hypothetical protein